MATRTALGKLIDSARAPENLSLQDIADRATRHGAKLSKQTVSRLAGEQLDSINVDNIRGLALGLGISERRVAAAALETMGIDLAQQVTPLRQAILDAAEVGESTKRVLLTIINEALHRPDLMHASGPQVEVTSQDDLALAARKPPPGGSRGRQVRRAQDEDATGSQDPGGVGDEE